MLFISQSTLLGISLVIIRFPLPAASCNANRPTRARAFNFPALEPLLSWVQDVFGFLLVLVTPMNQVWMPHRIVGYEELIGVSDNHAPVAITSGTLTLADVAVMQPANCNRTTGVNLILKQLGRCVVDVLRCESQLLRAERCA